MSEERDEPVYYDRIPDPRMRFVNNVGGNFALGLLGSSAFNLFRGFRAVYANAPRAAGSLVAFVAVLSAVDSAASAARRKEDGWNGLAAGAAAWAALGARRGLQIVECRFSDWHKDPEDTPPPQPQRTRPLPAASPAADATGFWGIPQAHQRSPI